MSDNESKLVFDTLIGNDTLTKVLNQQLNVATLLTTELGKIKTQIAAAKAPLDKEGISLVGISSLRTTVELYHKLLEGKEAVAKMSTGLGLKAGDLTTLEGMINAMHKLVGVTEKYSQLSNKKLQLAAFDGTLTREQFDQHKSNINALKAMNKGFAQGQAQLDADAKKMAKEGIKLVEEHTRKLKEQAVEKNKIARRDAAEAVNTRATLKRKASEGSLTRADIKNARTPEELKAIQSGITDRYHNPKLTNPQRQVLSGLEDMVQKRLVKANITPFEKQSQLKFSKLDDFKNLQADQKGESKVGLSLLARRIATLKKEGGSYAQVVQMEALHQAARDIHAEKFRPSSAFQLREKENQRVANLPQNMPLTNLSSLTSRDEVARQLRMSSIRSKEMSEGPAKQAEILYANALKAHGLTLEREPKQRQAIVEKAQKIVEANSRKEADAVAKQRMAEAQERAKIREAEAKAARKVQQLADRASQKALERQRKLDDESPSSVLRRARQSGANAEISKTDSGYAVKVRQAQEAGALTVVRQERKQRNDRELEHLSLTRYQRMSDLAGLDAAEIKQAKRVLNYRNGMATAGGRVEKLNIEMLQELSKQQAALAKKTRADEKLATHNQRMATDSTYRAKYQLAEQQGNLKAGNVDARLDLAASASHRLSLKARNEEQYRADIAARTYATPAALQALSTPQQIHDAKASLNYQANNSRNKEEEGHARMLLQLLGEIHGKKKAIAGTDNLIAQLEKTHYQTKASLNGLGREELQQAIAVLSYRRSIATTEQQRAAAQNLLNTANQAYKVNPEHQADNREAARTRILGDAGASVLTIQAGLMLNYKLLAGMQGLFSNALSSVVELDSAFRQLQAISASTNTEMVSMKQNLILVAQASKFSAAEVGNTAVLLAQAGYSIGEISQSMKGVIALAQATGTELGKSVDVVTSVLSVFNKGAGETNQVVNQLTEALNRSKLDINKMSLGIQYAGNIAADSGVSFEELTSALGAMANAGIRSGSTLGTGLRQMFIDLQKPSEKLKVRLDALGLSLDQVDLHSNGLVGVLENLRNAGFTSADAFQTFEVRAASAFAALSGNISDFNDLKESLNDTNAAFEANGVQLEALAVQLDHLKSNLGILSAEALKPVATLVRDFAKETAHMMENTKESSGALMAFGTALAGIGVAVAVGWMAKLSFELVGLLAGLWRMPAAFGAARAAMILHNTGLKVLTGETLAATAATASLWGALVRFAPLLIGVAVGVGVITAAYRSYANELGKLNDKLDQAKAAFNKAKENAATAKTAYDNVNEAIGNLTAKYGVLSESQTATTDEAQSLVTKFGEMGFAIDDLANVKVSQLMQKLQELRGELSKEYSSEVTAKFGAEINRLKAALGVANNVLGSNKFTSRSMEAEAQALQGNRKAGKGGAEAEVLRLQAYDPKVLAHVAKSLLAVKDFQKEGGVASTFNVKQAKGDLTSLIAHSNLNAFQANLVEQYFKKYVEDTFAAYDTRQSYSADVQKADFKHTRDKMSIKGMADASESGTAFSAATGSQLDFIKLSAQVDKQQSHVSLRERTLLKAKLAGEANSVVQRNIKIYDDIIRQADTELETLAQAGKAATKPYNDKLALRGTWIEQRSELQKNNSPLVDAMRRGSELSDKDKLALLENQLETEKRHLVSMEKVYDKETSISTSNKLAKGIVGQNDVIGNLIQDITRLKHKSSVELEAMLKADVQKQTYVLEDWAAKVKEHNTALTQENSKEAVDQELKLGEKNLKDYEQSYRDFKDQYDLNNELFDKEQKAIRRRFENQGKRVLNSGEMFKGLNKELSARAQEAANNSGIPQEYAQYGQGIGGFFARQAAEAKSGVVLHQLKQKKLALDFINLQSVEARFKKDSANYKVPEVEAKLAEQRKRVADLDAQILDPNTSRKDELRQTRQDLQASIDLKIKALEQHKALVKDYEEERQRLLADIENLKDDLATVDENALAFKNSFAAGRQALDAGLSAGFQDWATQTIKNIDDVEAAFKSMGLSILQSMLKVVSDRTAMAFTNMLLGNPSANGGQGNGLGLVGTFGSWIGSLFGGTSSNVAGVPLGSVASSLASTTFGSLIDQGAGVPIGTNSVLRRANGGMVKGYSGGGYVSGTGIGRDSVPAMLMPNEYVLKPSATSALGKPFLDRLNATTTGSLKQLDGKAQAPQINVVQSPPTNVYVVSPDQANQMGPNDVVVTIEDNISRNGSIKQLIKQVVSGEA